MSDLLRCAAAALFLSLVMMAAWSWQRRTANAGWSDVFWTFGLGSAGVVTSFGAGPRGPLVAAIIAVWALRLGIHIFRRTRGAPEDSRYAQLRREWGERFERRIFVFLQIQAAAAILLLIPLFSAAAARTAWGWRDGLALAIIAAAIAGEGLADAQLQRFRDDPAHHGKVCEVGLWRWSRHPNYFFEWLHWLAYPVLASGSAWFWPALIGPALMYWLLAHVSGIPLLEAQMLRSRGDLYRDYQRRVRPFFPFPRP
jgi:steroid 5-alpha reductase family enzyme